MPNPDERVNILAVDDSPEKLLALTAVLSELNQNVVTAASGREALRQLLRQEFAVILLDVNMPGLDGFETAALIRQRLSSEHTPIIFITAYGDQTHAVRGYSLGAVDYILAPVEPEVLKTKVMVFVELFRKTAEIRRQARTLENRALQFQRLTRASVAINSASRSTACWPSSPIWRGRSWARSRPGRRRGRPEVDPRPDGGFLSEDYQPEGERAVLRDRAALLSLLSSTREPVHVRRTPRRTAGRGRNSSRRGRPRRAGSRFPCAGATGIPSACSTCWKSGRATSGRRTRPSSRSLPR
jgi:CheY-like chemotaxis protein